MSHASVKMRVTFNKIFKFPIFFIFKTREKTIILSFSFSCYQKQGAFRRANSKIGISCLLHSMPLVLKIVNNSW